MGDSMRESFAKFVVVFKREFLERTRSRWFLVSTLVGPLFFACVTVVPAWLALREKGSSTVANVTIVDATGTDLGDRIARALADSAPNGVPNAAPAARPAVVRTTAAGVTAAERSATDAVVRHEREGVLVLDSLTVAGKQARYLGRNASSIADVERVREVVRREVLATRLAREGLRVDRVQSITGVRLQMPTTGISDKGVGRAGGAVGNIVVAFIVALLLYMMILLYGQMVLRSVIEEKTLRVAEVIISSAKPDILMAGKVVGVGAVGLMQTTLWLVSGFALTYYTAPLLQSAGMRPAGTVAAAQQAARAADATSAFVMPTVSLSMVLGAIAFFALGYLLYSALFAAAGAMVSSEQDAQQAAFPVMLPLIASATLIQVVLRNPESAGARAVAWFPLTAPIIMPMRMSLVSVSPLEVTLVILGVATACAAAIWLAARIYRVGLLMYGKRPSAGELLRWIRQAA